MSNNELEWEELVAKIREWDRREHDWATKDTAIEHKTRISKDSFIKSLMRTYDLKKK